MDSNLLNSALVEFDRDNYVENDVAPISNSKPQQIKGDIKSQKRVVCTVVGCTYSARFKKDLVRHMRKHTGEKPFACEACSRQFSRYDKLMQHTRLHEGVRLKCTELGCTYTCLDSTSLKRHNSRVHLNEKNFVCQYCSHRTNDAHHLSVHMRYHTGDSPYSCSSYGCTKSFKTSTDLQRHIRIHTQEKPFSCNHCDYKSAVKCNVNAHIKRKHPKDDGLKTSPDSYTTSPQTEADVNVIAKKTKKKMVLPFHIACRFCGYRTETIKSFKLHMLRKHKNSNYDSILNELDKTKTSRHNAKSKKEPIRVVKKYTCSDSTCLAKFVSQKSLKLHIRQHVKLHQPPPPVPTMEVVISAESSVPDKETERKYSNILASQIIITESSFMETSSELVELHQEEEDNTYNDFLNQKKQSVSVIAYADKGRKYT